MFIKSEYNFDKIFLKSNQNFYNKSGNFKSPSKMFKI